jgi:pimeloyl-ACP methyl ester carboxylesterase
MARMASASWKGRGIVEWLLVIAVIVIGVPAAAWFAQERLIFFPQPLVDTAHLPAHAQPFSLVSQDGTRLAGFVLPAETGARAPALLYFGGNAEEISWTLADRHWPRAWTIAGVNYRGYGRSEGRPGERELVADALALFDAFAARPDVDATRIVVVGRSLGTGVAARVAAERPVAATVLVSPYDSLVEIGRQHYPWLPVDWLLRHRFDSRSAAKRADSPLLTLVGTADGIIPLARSRALHEAWRGPKTWIAIEGAGHNDIGSSPAYWRAISRFLDTVAARP